MKISKRQLRKIIKEEKSKILNENRRLVGGVGFGSNFQQQQNLAEQPISGRQANQMQASQDMRRVTRELMEVLSRFEVTERNGEIYMLISDLENLASRG